MARLTFIGRDPGDDEDTVVTYTAKTEAEAFKQFKAMMLDGMTKEDIAFVNKTYGTKNALYMHDNSPLVDVSDELLEALIGLVKEIPLRGLNIRKDFSLINAHAAATKAIKKAENLNAG